MNKELEKILKRAEGTLSGFPEKRKAAADAVASADAEVIQAGDALERAEDYSVYLDCEADERKRKSATLRNLQRKAQSTLSGKELRMFLDEETNYYLSIGVNSFNKTHTSAVEYNVLKREKLEILNMRGRLIHQNGP